MTTAEELLSLFIVHKELFESGLCVFIYALRRMDIIDEKQFEKYDELIHNNHSQRYDTGKYVFYYPAGDYEARKRYLERLIKKGL
jgi:hypothetical protein